MTLKKKIGGYQKELTKKTGGISGVTREFVINGGDIHQASPMQVFGHGTHSRSALRDIRRAVEKLCENPEVKTHDPGARCHINALKKHFSGAHSVIKTQLKSKDKVSLEQLKNVLRKQRVPLADRYILKILEIESKELKK